MTATRRLAAILAADIAGYSRLIGADEGGTLQALKVIRTELIDPTIAAHNGRFVKIVEFGSVLDALQCATEDLQCGARLGHECSRSPFRSADRTS
jgi:adenylate cyclase